MNVYDGMWKEIEKGSSHGTGRYAYASGVVYDGEWKNNQKHGTGRYAHASDFVYIGLENGRIIRS